MTPVLTRPRPAPLRSRGDIVTAMVAVAGGIALLMLIVPTVRLPSFVDAVTISNPHPWHVEIDVDGPDRSGWIGLGGQGRETTQTYQSVIDHGTEWVFRFTHGGIARGELVLSRAQLDEAGWKVTVPEEFAQRLRASGELPSASG